MKVRAWRGFHWFCSWQNLDDDEKVKRADAALTDVLRRLGLLTNDRWQELSAAKQTFHNKLRGKLGHGWRNGRAWLYLYRGDPDKGGRKLTTIGAQWLLLKRQHSIGASVNVGGGDGDRDIDLSIRIPGFGLYLSAEDVLPRRWQFFNPGQKYPSSRELGITWHNQAFWIALWRDPDEAWGRGGPPFWKDARSRQRHIVIHPLDILLGDMRCTTEQLGEQAAEVGLPEGTYPVRVRIERRTWTRPRWPWGAKTRITATVESEQGLPIPGKGENSHDCGDDAYYSIGTPAATIEDAVNAAAASVLETRRRYGGEGWQPGPVI